MSFEPPSLDAPQRPQVPWRALEGVGIQIITFGILALTLLAVALLTKNNDALSVIGTIVNAIALGVVTVFWVRLRHDGTAADLGLRDFTAKNLGLGIGVGFLGIFTAYPIAAAIITLIRRVTDEQVGDPCQLRFERAPSEPLIIFIGIAVVVLAPIAEEIFFRGFLFQAFTKWASPIVSAVIASALFGIAHLDPLLFAPTFVLGLLLAWVVRMRSSIVPSVVAHVTFNAYGFALIVPELLKSTPPC